MGTIESGSVRLDGVDAEKLFRKGEPVLAQEATDHHPSKPKRKLQRAEFEAPIAPGMERHYSSAAAIERTRRDYEG